MLAFLSYQTKDRRSAADAQSLLADLKIDSFLAHEDIDVSKSWQREILIKLRQADIFIALLSQSYLKSAFCIQESGIAVFREKQMSIIPLSLDGTVSPGFLAHIQSRRVTNKHPLEALISDGLFEHDPSFILDRLINQLSSSASFRGAEANFVALQPRLHKATDDQIVRILEAAVRNGQISHAGGCARVYLPPLFASHGRRLNTADRRKLRDILKGYAT